MPCSRRRRARAPGSRAAIAATATSGTRARRARSAPSGRCARRRGCRCARGSCELQSYMASANPGLPLERVAGLAVAQRPPAAPARARDEARAARRDRARRGAPPLRRRAPRRRERPARRPLARHRVAHRGVRGAHRSPLHAPARDRDGPARQRLLRQARPPLHARLPRGRRARPARPARRIGRADLAGGSLGGNLVLRLGHRAPERFGRLVPWAPAGVWEPMRLLGALGSLWLRLGSAAFWPVVWVQSRFWYHPAWRGREGALREAFRTTARSTGAASCGCTSSSSREQVTDVALPHRAGHRAADARLWGDQDHALGMGEGVKRLVEPDARRAPPRRAGRAPLPRERGARGAGARGRRVPLDAAVAFTRRRPSARPRAAWGRISASPRTSAEPRPVRRRTEPDRHRRRRTAQPVGQRAREPEELTARLHRGVLGAGQDEAPERVGRHDGQERVSQLGSTGHRSARRSPGCKRAPRRGRADRLCASESSRRRVLSSRSPGSSLAVQRHQVLAIADVTRPLAPLLHRDHRHDRHRRPSLAVSPRVSPDEQATSQCGAVTHGACVAVDAGVSRASLPHEISRGAESELAAGRHGVTLRPPRP